MQVAHFLLEPERQHVPDVLDFGLEARNALHSLAFMTLARWMTHAHEHLLLQAACEQLASNASIECGAWLFRICFFFSGLAMMVVARM